VAEGVFPFLMMLAVLLLLFTFRELQTCISPTILCENTSCFQPSIIFPVSDQPAGCKSIGFKVTEALGITKAASKSPVLILLDLLQCTTSGRSGLS